jgi:hypothetical protein
MHGTLRASLLLLALVVTQIPNDAWAVYETVVIEKPFHSRSLSGFTMDPSGAVLAGVEVSDYDPNSEQVFASTVSDQQGHFALPRNGRSVHHLKFLARGMNPLEITVVLRIFAQKEIKVKLPIGG